jgi:hypothetical protein
MSSFGYGKREGRPAPWLLVAAVCGLSLAWFGAGVQRVGLGSPYGDPISRIGAQDDAVYAREAIEMARTGNWLTPEYLGRYALNKPPLLQWLAAASVALFGISAWALRVPSMLAASLIVTLMFLLARRVYSTSIAATLALLLASSHLFYTFARLCMTDMLLTFWITAAVCLLAQDPALRRRFTIAGFGVCTAAAIMTKAVAGVLPVLALLLAWAFLPRGFRPRLGRILGAVALAAAIALPWHIYQAAVHGRWFVAEYILTQHLAVGVTAPPQYSNENHLVFYARRLFLMDPVLALLAAASLPILARNRARAPILLAWLVATVAVLFGFRYRSAYYLLPLLPVLGWMAAEGLHALHRFQAPVLAGVLACAVIKTVSASPLWGISAGRETHVAMAPALESYCGQHRANGLILVGADDQFYASDLPLARVRYCLLMPPPPAGAVPPPLDFARLGISLSVSEFDHIDMLRPIFRARLADFDLPSDGALGTVIRAGSLGEIAHLIEAHPQTDFWIPAALLRTLNVRIPQTVQLTGSGGVLLLGSPARPFQPERPCHL